MKKLNIFKIAVFMAITTTGAFAQQITDPAVLWAASPGGARILSTQGNTAASPAIGFQSSVSSTGAPQEDGGGGNGIFRPLANTMAFSTASLERMRINQAGFVGIGTSSATNQLEVVTNVLTNPAIFASGKSVGIYAEATAQESNLIKRSNFFGDLDGIAVFGNAKYTTNTTNGSMYGVVGSATDLTPLNNIGVFGEAKNGSGYNSGVIGYCKSTTGLYNTGVAGQVELNSTAAWNRAIYGVAPVATNHFAGYFDGKVAIVDGTQANNYVLTSDANGLASWKDACTLPCLSASTTFDWHLNGNALTNPATDYIGTSDAQPLNISTGGTTRMLVDGTTGNIGVGTATPLHKLHVNDGALMLSGAVAGFGGPQLLFSDNVATHPNGRWGIEYISAIPGSGAGTRPSMGGLNFWTPFNPGGGSGTAGNYSLFLKDDGKIGMGATDDAGDANFCASALPNGYRLYVNGGILTTKVKVANYCSSAWADYVFANDYKLKPLSEVESFINANKHLPNVPSATQIEKDGLDLADMQSKQMEKIEELTLYLIAMEKKIKALENQNEILANQIAKK